MMISSRFQHRQKVSIYVKQIFLKAVIASFLVFLLFISDLAIFSTPSKPPCDIDFFFKSFKFRIGMFSFK